MVILFARVERIWSDDSDGHARLSHSKPRSTDNKAEGWTVGGVRTT